jgi:hypothetical protein
MAKDMKPIPEQPSESKGESGAGQKSFTNAETERRVTALEKSVSDLNNRVFDAHKWFVTVLFSVVAVMLTVYGVLSRLDVRESTREMEVKVDKATADMEKKFQALAGEALKKPVVELLNESVPLEGQEVQAWGQFGAVGVGTLFLKNIGDKRTDPISIRISVAAPLHLYVDRQQDWESVASYEKDYQISFNSTRHPSIAPGEILNVHPLFLDWSNVAQNTNFICKIQVFYGGEKPAEASFRIKPKWQ